MKTNIQIFTSEVFGEIRTCQVNNQIMFVGKDVAQALGYAKPENAIATHVDTSKRTGRPERTQHICIHMRTLVILIHD